MVYYELIWVSLDISFLWLLRMSVHLSIVCEQPSWDFQILEFQIFLAMPCLVNSARVNGNSLILSILSLRNRLYFPILIVSATIP